MAFPRASFFFADQRFAWSETYYLTGQPTLDTCLQKANALAQKRVQLLGRTAILNVIRVSYDDHKRDAMIDTSFDSNLVDVAYNPILNAEDVAPPESCLLVRVFGSNGPNGQNRYVRNLFMAGMPAKVIDEPGHASWDKIKGLNRAWQYFAIQLANGDWGIKVLAEDPDGNPPKAIQGIIGAAGQAATVHCQGHGFQAGDKVRIQQAKQVPFLQTKINGTWTVSTVVDANNFTIPYFEDPRWKSGGFALGTTHIVVPIFTLFPREGRSRKRGVTGYSPPRGRSRKRSTVVS